MSLSNRCAQLSRRGVLVGIAGATLSSCGLLGPQYIFKFKITVYALVNGVRRIGSTVIRSEWKHYGNTLDSGQRWVGRNYGDAITIATDGDGAVFGLLSSIPGHNNHLSIDEGLFLHYFPNASTARDGEPLFQEMSGLVGEQEMPRSYWPIVVGFSHLNSASTATLLWPEDGLAKAPRVVIDRVTLELSGGSESDELSKKLPWFSSVGKFPGLDYAQPVQSLPLYQQLASRNIHANGEQL